MAVGNSRAATACGDFLCWVSQISDTQIQIPRPYLPELQRNDRNSVEVDLAAAREPSHKVRDSSKRFYQSRGTACIPTSADSRNVGNDVSYLLSSHFISKNKISCFQLAQKCIYSLTHQAVLTYLSCAGLCAKCWGYKDEWDSWCHKQGCQKPTSFWVAWTGQLGPGLLISHRRDCTQISHRTVFCFP